MPLRRAVKTVATTAAIGASAAIGVLAFGGTAGALTNGTQYPGTALAQTPFTPGTPFDSGQVIEVKVPANTIFPPSQNVQIQECQALPGGLPPTSITACDGLTTYPSTNLPKADGSFDIKDYSLYSLPNALSLGETPSSAVHCDLGHPCVLYIGLNAQDFTQPHIWSQAFVIHPNATDTAPNPGDGTPELPLAIGLPLAAAGIVGGSVLFRRRRSARAAA
jgi:hypothetical protein